jgi:magnesium transporter
MYTVAMNHPSFFLLRNGERPAALASIEEASRARGSGGFVWLNFVDPDKREITGIIPAFGIHPLSVEDCFDENQIPKIDVFPEYTSILFNDLSWREGDGAVITELNAFFGDDFLVTVMRGETGNRCPDAFVLGAIGHAEALSPARLLQVILDRLVDLKFDAVEKAGDLIAELEDRVIAGGNIAPAETQATRKNLLVMRKSLYHEREVLEELRRKGCERVPENTNIFFSDIYDHLAKFAGMVDAQRETVTSLAQMQLAVTSNQMAEASNRTNRSVNRLTVITTICMPLSLIAGIGGMSEWSMMTGPENWRISYAALIGGMVILGLGNFFVIKWIDKWKDRKREE